VSVARPSRTALGAAGHRAAHQVLEHGAIFFDPLAVRILGHQAAALIEHARDPGQRRLRLFIAARSRFAEDALSRAVAAGVRQVVILGAGLDTWAYRSSFGGQLRVFEVDHPATQAWKRERLAEARIGLPPQLIFAPIDLERESLADALAAATFDPTECSFFSWLGVVPYLHEATVYSTLGFIAGLAGGATVVFDYGNPLQAAPSEATAARAALAERVASAGEPFRSTFETHRLHSQLLSSGFEEIEDLGPAQIAARYVPGAASAAMTSAAPDRGGHLVRARRVL